MQHPIEKTSYVGQYTVPNAKVILVGDVQWNLNILVINDIQQQQQLVILAYAIPIE